MGVKDIRIVDFNAKYFGYPPHLLMENAGRSVTEKVLESYEFNEACLVCGTGNNGGDGFVAARHLRREGKDVCVILLGSENQIKSKAALLNWLRLTHPYPMVDVFEAESPEKLKELRDTILNSEIVIDAILGIGIKGDPKPLYAEGISLINSSKGKVVSIDIPSGLDADTGVPHKPSVKADLTISLHALKPGLLKAKEYTGELTVASIGLPQNFEQLIGPGDVFFNYPKRERWSHKGDFGYLHVIGGSEEFSGAPFLVGMAALRTGVDLVIVSAPSSISSIIRSYSPNLVVRELEGRYLTELHLEELLLTSLKCDATVIGPGLGLQEETKKLVQTFLKEIDKPIVIDADALKAIASKELLSEFGGRNFILTPHSGEFSMLSGEHVSSNLSERVQATIRFTSGNNFTVVLKGSVDIVAHHGQARLNFTGNPGMTVGGTGDVLSGVIASFLSWGVEPFEAACCGVFLTGYSGDLASKEYGDSLLATDVIETIPKSLLNISSGEITEQRFSGLK